MARTLDDAIVVLEEIAQRLREPDTDVAYSRYNSREEAVADINSHLGRLRVGDHSGIGDLESLFGPTGSLQEISLTNGWGERFLDLAARFDGAVEERARKVGRSRWIFWRWW